MLKVLNFLTDSNIEHLQLADHIGTYQDLPFNETEMVALAKFWGFTIERGEHGSWILNGYEIRRY